VLYAGRSGVWIKLRGWANWTITGRTAMTIGSGGTNGYKKGRAASVIFSQELEYQTMNMTNRDYRLQHGVSLAVTLR
jgi:hypothetical protein